MGPETSAQREENPLSIQAKALAINLDKQRYGAFAEIGAGQVVVRWFFRAGGAAGTIAKSTSAYDMAISDSVYGRTERYVSRARLHAMLDHEHQRMLEVLRAPRGVTTAFFTFADTVSAKSFKGTNEQHGWMGIRFQATPGEEDSQIILHVRMLDRDNATQSEALGIVGVNLVYGACFLHHEPQKLIESLLDNLSTQRIEIDMIEFSGAAFRAMDNRVASLVLVQLGLSGAAMFDPDCQVLQPSEVLYKRPVLVQRGTFRPFTLAHADILRAASEDFGEQLGDERGKLVELVEISMRTLLFGGKVDYQDFLARADVIAAAGKTVLISDYAEYYRLVGYLQRYTRQPVGIALGAGSLLELFKEDLQPKLEQSLAGGLLEAVGRTFRNDTRLFVYPWRDPVSGGITSVENLPTPPAVSKLYAYLVEQGWLRSIRPKRPEYLSILPADVARRIQQGDASWEADVPAEVAAVIKNRALFGYRPS